MLQVSWLKRTRASTFTESAARQAEKLRKILIFLVWYLPLSGIAAEEPQYIFFNLSPGEVCKQNDPKTFSPELLKQIRAALDVPRNPRLEVGVSFIFSLLEDPPEVLGESLRKLLEASRASGVPVLIGLDGQNWWQNRPDLWNWWDPTRPGFNTENANNVEWTDWDIRGAVKISWRNWGTQLRIAPAPNIASAKVVGEVLKGCHAMIPIMLDWYARLPPEEAHLFGGVKLGWETGIGYNAFYYPEGNSYLDRWPDDASHDPVMGLDKSKGISGGLEQLGYAAVKTARIKTSGDLTARDLAEVTQQYLQMLTRTAFEHGMPSHLITTHQGGTYAPWEKRVPFWPAINALSTPGWSFYGLDPAACEPLAHELDRYSQLRWCAAEWWWGAPDAAGWQEHFKKTLAWRDCQYVCVFNWESFAKDLNARAGLAGVVKSFK